MQDIIHEASFLIPKQAILENFVHHNPREMLQHMDFFEADEHVKRAKMYLSPGERIQALVCSDPRVRANAAVSELCAVFLDRGVAKWGAPNRNRGFLYFFASLELLGFSPWRKYARTTAKKVMEKSLGKDEQGMQELAEDMVNENLDCYGTATDLMTTLRSMFFDLPGWTSMFWRMETEASEAPHGVRVKLADFAAVLTILHRSSIEEAAYSAGFWDPNVTPMGQVLDTLAPVTRTHHHDLQNPSGLAYLDQNISARERLEKQVEKKVLGAIMGREQMLRRRSQEAQLQAAPGSFMSRTGSFMNRLKSNRAKQPDFGAGLNTTAEESKPRPIVQFLTSFDEREGSFRRHLEGASGFDAEQIETFGVAGFFDFPMWCKHYDASEEAALAPASLVPRHHLVEVTHQADLELARTYNFRRQLVSSMEVMWERASFGPVGCLLLSALSPLTLARLAVMCLCPKKNPLWLQPICDKFLKKPRTDFKLPMTPAECAQRLAKTFKNIGLMDLKHFAPVVVILGHGSRTVNNPFDAAHNSSACGGRDSGANARLMVRAANLKEVRKLLLIDHGIAIPDDTWFVGGRHDTTSDDVELFDADPENVPPALTEKWQSIVQILTEARGKSAMERSEKFLLSYDDKKDPNKALLYVQSKSMDLGEPRPELGHATNATVVIGPRELTKGCFLARRASLPSYEPKNDDERGTNLEFVMTPALILCSGVSLQYLFSTVEGGAGTKVALNIVGEHGVMQGASGDLMLGLPTQLTEMHSPVRSMFVVHAPLERVQAVLRRREDLRNIVHNQWIRLFVYDSETKKIYEQQSKGQYVEVKAQVDVSHVDDVYRPNELKFVPFAEHLEYSLGRRDFESKMFTFVIIASVLSCLVPLILFNPLNLQLPFKLPPALEFGDYSPDMNPCQGVYISISFTLLSLLIFAFSRRYLHGEFMFSRLMLLGFVLLSGFNLVSLAPELRLQLLGWTLMGWSWTFMVGAYSDRPTVKDNAMFIFFTNQISDASLLLAVAVGAEAQGESLAGAFGLIIAAFLKTSQFPVLNIFQRSSEAASPCSALGNGVLCANAGMVLLVTTRPHWFHFMSVRAVLAAGGALTAVLSGLVAQIRGDRMGSLGHAIAATVGVLYIVLAAGYVNTALFLSFGHCVTRVMQILRSHNLLLEHRTIRGHLQDTEVWARPKPIAEWLYCVSWSFNRLSTDVCLPLMFSHLPRPLRRLGADDYWKLGKWQQRWLTAVLLYLGGAPLTYTYDIKTGFFIKLVETSHFITAFALLTACVLISTSLVWIVFHKVLDNKTRFLHERPIAVAKPAQPSLKDPLLRVDAADNNMLGA